MSDNTPKTGSEADFREQQKAAQSPRLSGRSTLIALGAFIILFAIGFAVVRHPDWLHHLLVH